MIPQTALIEESEEMGWAERSIADPETMNNGKKSDFRRDHKCLTMLYESLHQEETKSAEGGGKPGEVCLAKE